METTCGGSGMNNFECPRCGHCCQAEVSKDIKQIKTWSERCEEHPDHQTGMITERMIQERMQEEIDELRQALEAEKEPGAWISERGDVFLLVNGIWMKWDLSCES